MATAGTLEAKSQEDCSLKFVKACAKDCPANCTHYFSIDDRNLSEQDIERRYKAFKIDPKYHSQ